MSKTFSGVKTGVVTDDNGKLIILNTSEAFNAEFKSSDNTIGISNYYNPMDIYSRLVVFIESQPEH